jgi:hypothetical protein
VEEFDHAQPAIVFWLNHPGEITRFDRLDDAVRSVMEAPSAKTASVAWIKGRDRHIEMDEIRRIARRVSLGSRLARISQIATATDDTIKQKPRLKTKPFWWPVTHT